MLNKHLLNGGLEICLVSSSLKAETVPPLQYWALWGQTCSTCPCWLALWILADRSLGKVYETRGSRRGSREGDSWKETDPERESYLFCKVPQIGEDNELVLKVNWEPEAAVSELHMHFLLLCSRYDLKTKVVWLESLSLTTMKQPHIMRFAGGSRCTFS